MRSICFSHDDVALFSAVSHDRNPLHLSSDYARKTPYGEPVVFGVLGLLVCLGQLVPPPGYILSSVRCEFLDPMFPGIDYRIETLSSSATATSFKLWDGTRLLLKGSTQFVASQVQPLNAEGAGIAPRTEARDLGLAECIEGLTVSGSYAPDWEKLSTLREQTKVYGTSIGPEHLAALLWGSYLVGMELPGRQALFAKLALDFKPAAVQAGPFEYQVVLAKFDPRFNQLRLRGQMMAHGNSFVQAELTAFVRQESPHAVATAPRALSQEPRLQDRVALVVGASRGLGAAIARELAREGCSVVGNYFKSKPEAESVQASVAGTAGCLTLEQGNASDPGWCGELARRIRQEYGQLDLLVCVACPPLLPLWLDANSISRINNYVNSSLALVSAPLGVFLDMLVESKGHAVVVSSFAVHQAPADWPHYVSAKYAIEGLVRAAAAEYPAVHFLIVRPPRLLTDLTNTPLGRQGALPPEQIADQLIARLVGTSTLDGVDVLEEF